MAKEILDPDNVYTSQGYSHGIKVGNAIYLCGQAPFNEEREVVGKGDIATQVTQSFENMKRTLEAAGATMADVVKLGFWVTDYDEMPKIGEAYRKYFQPPFPAALGVEISRHPNPDIMIQVTAIAVVE